MNDEFLKTIVEHIAKGIEFTAVIIIACVFIYAIIGSLINLRKKDSSKYLHYKIMIAKVLQTGLEFLVAADIIRTVIIDPTLEAAAILGLLVVIRTFLSWSLVLETEGRWPWQPANKNNPEENNFL